MHFLGITNFVHYLTNLMARFVGVHQYQNKKSTVEIILY